MIFCKHKSHRFCNRCDWRTRFAPINEYITLIISNDFLQT
nr:MAG TPA: NADH-PPase NADH pyrophosphatase zinc ribbon domain [Caudoviricetes sp.]